MRQEERHVHEHALDPTALRIEHAVVGVSVLELADAIIAAELRKLLVRLGDRVVDGEHAGAPHDVRLVPVRRRRARVAGGQHPQPANRVAGKLPPDEVSELKEFIRQLHGVISRNHAKRPAPGCMVNARFWN